MRQFLFDTINFFFPLYCPVCGNTLHIPSQVICLPCENDMPRTNYIEDQKNLVAQLFWGRIHIAGAISLFRFEKGSKYQTLLHLLKYKGEKQIGTYLGQLLGSDMLKTDFAMTDYLIPVPLHKKKKLKRGYNQSEIIAEGVSLVTGIPVHNSILYRITHTESQTKKARWERWENMENVFDLKCDPEEYSNKKLLIIDDVVTTGSTLEACAASLLKIPGVQIYIATVACA